MFFCKEGKLDKDDSWKTKAKKRRQEIKELKKRILELEKSRNIWKSKTTTIKKKNKILEEELKKTSDIS